MKKVVSLVVAIMLLLSLTVTAYAGHARSCGYLHHPEHLCRCDQGVKKGTVCGTGRILRHGITFVIRRTSNYIRSTSIETDYINRCVELYGLKV